MVNDKNICKPLLACRSILSFFPCFTNMENSCKRGIFVQLVKVRWKKSSNLPWNYSKNIDHLLVQINIMFQQSCLIQTGTVAENNHKTLTEMINHLGAHLFPNFRCC